MAQTFFDRQGSPIAYSDDDVNIYLYSGRAAAYIDGGSIHAFSGKHLGTLRRGWVRDSDGHCVFFTERAISASGPPMPTMRAQPTKNVKKPPPAKGLKQSKPATPARRRTWSQLSGQHFFEL